MRCKNSVYLVYMYTDIGPESHQVLVFWYRLEDVSVREGVVSSVPGVINLAFLFYMFIAKVVFCGGVVSKRRW